jgi:hypothetical protein
MQFKNGCDSLEYNRREWHFPTSNNDKNMELVRSALFYNRQIYNKILSE